jgi:hypothetical protein
MIIELQRKWIEGDPIYVYPDGGGTICAVCGHPFEEPSVVAYASTDARGEMGVVCVECVNYLGRRNPEKFPTPEEYKELLAKYPQAMYPSVEALEAAGKAAGYEDSSEIAYEPSWVWRRPSEAEDASA